MHFIGPVVGLSWVREGEMRPFHAQVVVAVGFVRVNYGNAFIIDMRAKTGIGKLAVALVVAMVVAQAVACAAITPKGTQCKRAPSPGFDNLDYGAPCAADQIVNRMGYALGYSKKHKQPLWVAYRLTADEVTNAVVCRATNYLFDESIVGGTATLEDFRGSGYGWGHLAPAADMRWNAQAMEDSFLFSNISPQASAFNGGIWKRLEKWVRDLAVRRGAVFVITGPVFPKDEKHETIGASKVTVPKSFYKVVLDERPPMRMIGFVMPNKLNRDDIREFAVSVDEVEKATGLDFFSALPKDVQEKLESDCDIRPWDK